MTAKHIIYTAGKTLYGKADEDASPWGSDAVALTEIGSGLYLGDTDNPLVYVQAGGSPADTDTFVADLTDLFYGTVAEGDLYHATRMHTWDWTQAATLDKVKSLYTATRLIDQFRYHSSKSFDSQELSFPRGEDTEPPLSIRQAAYLIAEALLSGRQPEEDFEALMTKVETFGPVRTEFERARGPQEHLSNLIPSPSAWALIKPYLSISTTFTTRKG